MTFSDRKHTIFAVLLLGLFLSFQGGRMLCYHTHVFGNVIVSHSHPFNNPDRQHSASELESLSIIAASLLTDNSTAVPELPMISCENISYKTPAVQKAAHGHSHSLKNRAPPYLHVI